MGGGGVVWPMHEQREVIRGRLRALGFDDVRFARAEPAFGAELREWLEAGYQADMGWLERGEAKRGDPRLVVPGARTVIMLGVNYWAEKLRGQGQGAGPAWARYALYSDYHDTMKAALVEAGRVLEEVAGVGPGDYRYYVDTGPLLERGWAAKAGMGFTGKNAMLISRRFGNWLFLAGIVTTAEWAPDEVERGRKPAAGHAGLLCGKCTRCLEACPTEAFAAPGVVDARRCVSYQTIENKGIIPRALRAGIGNRIYGCDTCLEVCPWNRFAQEGRRVLLAARFEVGELSLAEVLGMTPERFAEVFRKTAIKRIKWAGLVRNACVVAGNTGSGEYLERLVALAEGGPAVVRAHAVWAVARLGGLERLREAFERETDEAVKAEYAAEGWN